MTRRPFVVLFALLLTIGGAFLRARLGPGEEEREGGRSGAREALDFWSASRAYPDADIPDGAYTRAYAAAKANVKEFTRGVAAANIWEPIGPLNLQGRSLAVAINPLNTHTIYVGTASGGLWRSHTRGQSADWQRLALGVPALGVGAIAIHPADSNTVYVGTGEVYRYRSSIGGHVVRTTRGSYGVGILKTTDGGATWTKSLDWSLAQQRGVQKILLNPENPNTVFAATTEGIFKSSDAGATWTNTLAVLMAEDLAILPGDTTLLMASVGNFATTGAGLYLSVDAGESWFRNGSFPAFSGKTMLGQYAADPVVVFASVATDSVEGGGAVWKTSDFGNTWNAVNTTPNGVFGVQGWYSHIIAPHPTDPLQVFHAGVPAKKSYNGGVTFGGSSGSYSDHHGYAIDPNDPDVLYVVNDDGVYRSTDFGDTFTNVGFGMQSGQFYNGFSCSAQDSLMAIGQSQDHIPGYKYNGSANWNRSASDEVGWTAIDQTNDAYVYAGSRFGNNIIRSADGGNSFTVGYSFSGTGAWNSPFVVSPSSPTVLYFGDQRVWRSTDRGATFAQTNAGVPLDNNPAISMGISANGPDTVYVGTAPMVAHAHIWGTNDGGVNWVDITGPLPDRYPLDIAVDPKDAQTVYVAMGGFGAGHFFKSTNGGGSWADITGTLPDAPGTAVVVDPDNSAIVYAGNDIGVFVSTNGGTTWSSFSQGLPDAVIAADLVISPSNHSLRIATHGAGVYERSLLGLFDPTFFNYRALALNSPSDGQQVLVGGTVSPIVATFRNSGSVLTTDSVDVSYRILLGGTAVYSDARRLGPFLVGESRQVTFTGSYHPPQPGVYDLEAVVAAADSNAADDTLRGTFTVFELPSIATPAVTKDYCPYTEITGGAAGPSGDDAQSSTVLPFTFVYDGYGYNQVQISTNGWIELGAGTAGSLRGLSTSGQLGSFFSQALGSTARPTKVLAPWWTDLATGSAGTISYKYAGAAPNRTATIQWRNVAANFDEGATTMKLNFQVVLHEGSNEVEFRYGPIVSGTFNPGASGAAFGLKDHIGGDYHYFDLARRATGLSSELLQTLTPAGNWPGADSCYHITTAGVTGVADEPAPLPARFALRQNYPNPFNPSTTIRYDLPERAVVSLRIYDLLGREVERLVEEVQDAGTHATEFRADALPSGVYFCRLTAGTFNETRKLLLLR